VNPALIETLSGVATAIAIAGVVLNNNKVRWCFALWLVSNGLTMGIHVHSALWTLAYRDWVFVVLAVHGWWKWGRRTQ
jgi:nicotinamide riboside transporter PnuC